MNLLSTVVVVHDDAAPEVRQLLAPCREHLALRAGVGWAGVDEVIGTSRVLACEACALLEQEVAEVPLLVLAAR
jgi:hypothetical protein